jgi:hypothetical protein
MVAASSRRFARQTVLFPQSPLIKNIFIVLTPDFRLSFSRYPDGYIAGLGSVHAHLRPGRIAVWTGVLHKKHVDDPAPGGVFYTQETDGAMKK